MVAKSDLTPSPCTYVRRFGSLLEAYELIGYKMSRDCDGMISHRDYRNGLRDELLTSFQTALPNRIKVVRLFNRRKPMLLIDGSIPCAVTLCPALITSDGRRRWLVRVRKFEKHYPSLLCVLDRGNTCIERMYLFAPVGRACWYSKQEHDAWFGKQTKIHSVGQLCSELLSIAECHAIPTSVLVPKTASALRSKQS